MQVRCQMSCLLAGVVGLFVGLSVDLPHAVAQDPDTATTLTAIQQNLIEVISRTERSVVAVARFELPGLSRLPETLPGLRLGVRPRTPRERLNVPGHPDFLPNDYGTGLIIPGGKEGPKLLILTNYHVVRGAPIDPESASSTSRLTIQFNNRRHCVSRIYAADPRSDLAVLALDDKELESAGLRASDLVPFKLTVPPAPRKGQIVLLLGNPWAIARDGSPSASWGLLSNIGRFPSVEGRRDAPDRSVHQLGTLLQIDARLNLGTSGGAVLNLRGQLVGMTTSLAALDGAETSAGYAVPINSWMLRIIGSLQEGFEVEYGFLGIQPEDVGTRDLRQYNSGRFRQVTAARAARIVSGSPADAGGLEPDDLVLAIDGRPVGGRYDLMREISLAGPGVLVRLRVWRESETRQLDLTVRLGKWPVDDEDAIVAPRARRPAWRGLAIDFPTARRRFTPGFRYPQGIVITGVAAGSPAAAAKLEPGDFIARVDETPVRTPAEFTRAVQARSGGVTLHLLDGRRIELSP